jgi:hypothetical protein
MPDTLGSYRIRVAELTKGKANTSGLRDDRRRSDLAGAGSADHVHRLTNELWPTPGGVGHNHEAFGMVVCDKRTSARAHERACARAH